MLSNLGLDPNQEHPITRALEILGALLTSWAISTILIVLNASRTVLPGSAVWTVPTNSPAFSAGTSTLNRLAGLPPNRGLLVRVPCTRIRDGPATRRRPAKNRLRVRVDEQKACRHRPPGTG